MDVSIRGNGNLPNLARGTQNLAALVPAGICAAEAARSVESGRVQGGSVPGGGLLVFPSSSQVPEPLGAVAGSGGGVADRASDARGRPSGGGRELDNEERTKTAACRTGLREE